MNTRTLVETLELERLETNLFRGTTARDHRPRIFGGQVIAQSLLAAYGTVEDRICHSLHCYFMRPGDPRIPILFEVDRSRDGGSFTTRRVVAIQNGEQIFNFSASFQAPGGGFEHQAPMPSAPHWDEIEDDLEVAIRREAAKGRAPKDWALRKAPVQLRTVGGRPHTRTPDPLPPVQQIWFRACDPIGESQALHQVVMAYTSDMGLLATSMRPHAVGDRTPGLQTASLDHAMWFHQPTDFNEWHLYHSASPAASGGRGLNIGYIYRGRDGVLVATCVQEGLIRLRPPAPAQA